MTASRPKIACLGAGRMGRGIAVAFAYAGHAVTMIDVKARSADQFATLEAEALGEIGKTLASLVRFGLLTDNDADAVLARVSVAPARNMATALADADIAFEGVPEVVDLKREVLAAASKCVGPDVIIASTTSTILVDDISGSVEHPQRFLNVHWLNPAYLIPLVEISPGAATDPAVTARIKALLEGIGKMPVVCAATPGFIVPRIQALAMNEAARMVEEGVARSRYLEGALGSDRYRAPEVISRNMQDSRIGMRTGAGFLDYSGLDVDAYREQRLATMVDLLRHFGLARPPVLDREL